MEEVCDKDAYWSFGISVTARRVDCGATYLMKCDTLRWFGLMIRMNDNDLIKRV